MPRLIVLQKDRETLKRIREQEEKLVVTAWYNLVGFTVSLPQFFKICKFYRFLCRYCIRLGYMINMATNRSNERINKL